MTNKYELSSNNNNDSINLSEINENVHFYISAIPTNCNDMSLCSEVLKNTSDIFKTANNLEESSDNSPKPVRNKNNNSGL